MLGLEQRYQGCLLGLAVGDAVGTTLEFKPRGSFAPINDLVGGGPFDLKPGQWTDDTSMALCLANSLIQRKGFDATDQMNRYCNWWQLGYMSSTGNCFDIGNTVSNALKRYLKDQNPYAGSTDPQSSGNGSLMRLAPVVMYYHRTTEKLLEYTSKSSQTTHSSDECVDACRYFATLLQETFRGYNKSQIIECQRYKPFTHSVQTIATCDYLEKPVEQIRGSGYVIESLEAALWSFANTQSFEQAVLTAANLGDDADTTAAICGQIAGAYYGRKGIKTQWLDKLYMRDEIQKLSLDIFNLQKP